MNLLYVAEPPRSSPQQDPGVLGSGNGPPVPPLIDTGNAVTYTDEYGNVAADNSTARELPTVSFSLISVHEMFLIELIYL